MLQVEIGVEKSCVPPSTRIHDPYLQISSKLKLGWHQESSRVTRCFSRWLWPVTKDSANDILFCRISGTHICRGNSKKVTFTTVHFEYKHGSVFSSNVLVSPPPGPLPSGTVALC